MRYQRLFLVSGCLESKKAVPSERLFKFNELIINS